MGSVFKDKMKIKKVKRALQEYNELFDVIEFNKIHKGPYSNRMPDLFVIPSRGVKFSNELKGIITEKTLTGDHEIHGVFSAYGDSIKESITFKKSPRVYDIVPTLLHIFGLPVPADTDGRVLMEIFNEDSEIARREPKLINRVDSKTQKIMNIKKITSSLKPKIANKKGKKSIIPNFLIWEDDQSL